MKKTTSRIAAALALAFAIGLAQTARADYWDWVGKGSGQTSYFDEHGNGKGTTGCWYHSVNTGSTDKFANDNHNFENAGSGGRPSFNSGWNKVVTFRKSSAMDGAVNIVYSAAPIVFVAEQPAYGIDGTGNLNLSNSSTLQIDSGTYSFGCLQIGITSGKTATLVVNGGTVKAVTTYSRLGTSGGSGVLTVKSGGTYDNTSAGNKNFTLGQDSGSSGTLNVQGGNVKVGGYMALNYHSSAKESHVNVTDGGVLEVNQIYLNNQGTSGGTFTIDDGTLKAIGSNSDYFTRFLPAGSGFNVYIGANAATIDANGHDIVISAALQDKSGDAGAVRFNGASVITLTGTPSYTGGTTVEAGTVLSLTAAAKAAIAAYPVYVEIPEAGVADGTTVFEINDGNGAFTQAEVDAMAITGTDASRYGLALADNGAKVVIADTLAGEYVWNDGASAASWRTSGKWTKNGTAGNWYDLVAAVFENAGDATTVDSAVAAESITFRANATVTGTATLTVSSVVVSNGVSATISAPTAGALEKTGPGTLTLGSARTAATTLSEGTLALAGSNQTTAWSDLAFGNGNAVALAIGGGATLTHSGSALYLANDAGQNVTMSIDDGGTVEVRNLFFGSGTGTVVFNGGTLKANQSYSAYGGLIGSDLTVTVTENGGTIDNGGYDILVSKDLDGAMSFTGSGTTTIGVNQSATGSMTVGGGTVALNAGLTVARSVAVDDGATLKATGAATLSGGVEFADGATLDVTGSDAVAASATFPVNGTVTLKKNGGAFARGLYPILAKTGITAAEVDGKLVPSLASGSSYGYCVKDDTLYLAVDVNMTHSVWTGAAGDGKMSIGGNWWSGTAPGAGDALDLSCITAAATIDCDIDATFGAVTMGSGVVTFAGSLTASSFSDTSKIAVGENSTVTLDGDLDFSNTAEACIVNTVATGGKFVVNGVIRQKSDAGDFNLLPCATAGGGAIVAKGGLSANKSSYFRLGRNGVGTYNWIVGSDGVVSGNSGGYWLYANENEPHTIIKPLDSDFPIAAKIAVREHAILTLVTTGDDGNPHTITLGDGSANYGIYREGTVNITGTGTVVANYNVSDLTATASQRVNPFVVTDTATLAIKAGKQITTGAINVNSDATLAFPETGTVTLAGNLTLASGSTLAFKVADNSCSVLAKNSKTITLPASGKVKVKLTADSLPEVGTSYTLTDGAGLTDTSKFELDGVGGSLSVDENGELVYTAPEYFYIKVAESDAGGFNINPAWFWAHGGLGFADTEKLAADIAQPAPNGYTYLQNYLLGYEPDDPASKLRIDDGRDGGVSGNFTLNCTFNVPDLEPESGNYVVKAKLLSSADGQNFTAVEGVDEQTVSARGAEETVSFAFTPDFTGGGMFRFFA